MDGVVFPGFTEGLQYEVLKQLFVDLKVRKVFDETTDFNSRLTNLRTQIDELDSKLITILANRMQIADAIGQVKKEKNVAVLQSNRWNEVLRRMIAEGEGKGLSEEAIVKKTGWTKELLEWQKELEPHKDFMKHLKEDFFQHRVFILTPKGDVIDLPDGSTTIDFAYAVHSDIGDHISGAKVNGKLVPLDTKLQNRDVVEIETKESSVPKRKWIEMAKTTLAKRKIRQYIRENGGLLDKFLTR
jgi:chorismate mutase